MFPRAGKRKGGDVCAIFVHAGAGYHSHGNEPYHLKACSDAAKAGMTVLRSGGSAVDAVEIAIKVLEDREITNSGYGSNLAMDGTVECDATIVDHLGRSGAVGAVSQIRNPISLARLILEQTLSPLSLHRVAPNLLVGQGATDFAFEKGMPVHPHDALISNEARHRWQRWKQDLMVYSAAQRNMSFEEVCEDEETAMRDSEHEENTRKRMREEHTQQMERDRRHNQRLCRAAPILSVDSLQSLPSNAQLRSGSSMPGEAAAGQTEAQPGSEPTSGRGEMALDTKDNGANDGSSDSEGYFSSSGTLELPSASPSPPPFAAVHTPLPPSPPGDLEISSSSPQADIENNESEPPLPPSFTNPVVPRDAKTMAEDSPEDCITDTVGAIAIDCRGLIAAGSSSGGIGMKHRGRVGPAALVGVGTTVIPADPGDPEHITVASVTSGTGEHMATTLASAKCAERIYNVGQMKKNGTVDVDENEAMKSMIDEDFMNHPGVVNSHSRGSIGVLAVKKTKDGIFLYFGHNTESFAIASMSSEELKPSCTMSRGNGTGAVSLGGRIARFRRGR